jgi:hypothetical protein
MIAQNLIPPSNCTNCQPVIHPSTSKIFFYLINLAKDSNFIQAELENKTEISFIVENLPKNDPQDGCFGWWLLTEAIHYFQSQSTITGIQGNWVITVGVPTSQITSDNLKMINLLTAAGTLTIEEAALQTWTGIQADRILGFKRVRQRIPATGTPGNYTAVHVLFFK